MFVNHAAFEEGMRYQRVTSYKIYPRQASEQAEYQVLVENIPSLFEEDLRIIHNKKEIPFWVEEKGKAWTKINKLLVNTPQLLFALSGHPSTKSGSSGDNTFEFFDDFSTDSIDTKWTVDAEPTHFTIADGVLKVNASGETNVIRTKTYSDSDYIIETKWKFTYWEEGGAEGALARYTDTSNFYNLWITQLAQTGGSKGMICGKRVGGSSSYSADYSNFTWSLNTWYDVKFIVEGNNLKGYWEGGLKSSQAYTDFASGEVGIRTWYSDLEIDDFRVRKYASSEPLIMKHRVSGKADIIKAIVSGLLP